MNDQPDQPDSAEAETPAATPALDERVAAVERALAEERRRSLDHLRRALLAEHAGSLVPELVRGDSPAALEASVAEAQSAFEAARQAALAELRQQQAPAPTTQPAPVPAGTPARDAVDHAALSPLQKIASGLQR